MTEINADQEEASDQEAETDQAREAEEVQDVAVSFRIYYNNANK
mgnify:FL=1